MITTIHATTLQARLADALTRIESLERANKRLQSRLTKIEKRPAQVKVVEYRNRPEGDLQ